MPDNGPRVLCRACGSRLNRVLVSGGYASHPCCDPDEQPWDWKHGRLRPLSEVRPVRAARRIPDIRPSERFRHPEPPQPPVEAAPEAGEDEDNPLF